ncbi:hypothetical protein Bca101_069305 [Brassica carinata]
MLGNRESTNKSDQTKDSKRSANRHKTTTIFSSSSIETTVDDASLESRQKRRRISETAKEADSSEINQESSKRWRTNRVQQIYASKLVEALRRVRQISNDGGKITSPAREIRDTADRVLAASARGTTQ